MEESEVRVRGGGLLIEVYEKSDAPERRLTKAALAQLEAEFRPLADDPSGATVRNLLPKGAIRRGAPVFELRKSSGRGVYDAEIRLNPGEPGMIYLKGYAVEEEALLSPDLLKARTNEWIGWSEDPEELFFANTEFIVYEAFSGTPYDALFEVWFEPDSGAPERMLLERGFRVEGW